MDREEVFRLIMGNNKPSNIQEIQRLLLKIADNILKDPGNPTFRILKKSNRQVAEKILGIKGGRETLLLMGFMENSSDFSFSYNSVARIENLKLLRNDIAKWKCLMKAETSEQGTSSAESSSLQHSSNDNIFVKPVKLPPLVHRYNNAFLRKINNDFHIAQVYANEDLKRNARKRIPVTKLERSAQKKLRDMQEEAKEGKDSVDIYVSLQDLILVEMLNWFKEDFFSWVDTPDCENCNAKTVFAYNTEEKSISYTNRVEMYKCVKCGKLTAFPRYNDLNILLETRKGRCGEWANVFTLMCCAMGWDARLVVDETDHVWTEVYSPLQKRWLHCDPSDNVCDTPLMYEHGWKKSLTYIIAYSPYELQDVTWRYSSDHKDLLKRRKLCKEVDLVKAIVELRNERLKNVSSPKRNYILRRSLAELADLLVERTPKDEEMKGRSSGSLNWRLARGETEVPQDKTSIIILKDDDLKTNQYKIRYSCALDCYETSSTKENIEKWSTMTYEQKNIIRKVEHDWKQVYLCRKEGTDTAHISWKFVLENTEKSITSLSLKFENKTFENGNVEIKIKTEEGYFDNVTTDRSISLKQPSKFLIVEACLSGGRGDHGWQHAQIFRQSVDSEDFPFQLSLYFE